MSYETWSEVDAYLNDALVGHDAALEGALASSAEAGLPPIAVAPNQGKLLHLLARLLGARRILEVGTLGGYSTIWLARALPEGGHLVTLEVEGRHAEVARANVAAAGLSDRVEIRVGPATESLGRLRRERRQPGGEPFDLVFIDADKPSNPDYFAQSLELTRPGSLIVVDNVVRAGLVADASSDDPAVVAIRRMHEMMAAEPRVEATAIQTVGLKGYDGLTFALVLGSAS